MTKRHIEKNPSTTRRIEYRKLEETGEAQAALWQALELLTDQGISLGDKAAVILDKRQKIKGRIPK